MSAEELFKIGKSTNPLLAGARGMVAGRFVLRQLNGITVISRRAKKINFQSEAQRCSRERFRQATAFAKKELMSTERKAHYNQIAVRAGLPNAYTAAIREYMRNRETVMKEIEPSLTPRALLHATRTRSYKQRRPGRSPVGSRPVKQYHRMSGLSHQNRSTRACEKDNRMLLTTVQGFNPVRVGFRIFRIKETRQLKRAKSPPCL